MKVVKLFPRKNSVFHFGNSSLETSSYFFRSDSLASTLACNYSELGNTDVKEFLENLPLISSLFIGLKFNNKSIYFIPKPSNFYFSETLIEKNRKLPKKVKFISLKAYEQYLTQKFFSESDFILLKHGFLVLNSELNIQMDLFETVLHQRNTVSRELGSTTENSLFSIEGIKLNSNKSTESFFYFFIDTKDISPALKKTIDLIKINGLGGDRSVGFGQIDNIEYDSVNIIRSKNNQKGFSLSTFIIDVDDFDKIYSYNLIKISGFISNSSYKRKSIFAFDVGSVAESNVLGKIVDLTPSNSNKKSYRYLKPFFLELGDNNE